MLELEHRRGRVHGARPLAARADRGKILPTDKFIEGLAGGQHRLPKNVLVHTLTGDFPPPGAVSIDVSDSDFVLEPDPATLTLVPWYNEPTAQVIADCVLRDGGHSPFYSRRVLARLLERYVERGWHPVIAPEIEFYLVEKNTDPDQPLKPPIGASGRREAGARSFASARASRSTSAGVTTTASRACVCRDAPPRNRRVENRLPGSDTNPYLTIAATLAAGYLGMTEALEPSPPVEGEETGAFETLPLDLRTALEQFEILGRSPRHVRRALRQGFTEVVQAEYDAYLRVVSSWERKFLLLAV
ncbi:Glutamine synthetase [Geodia barretti]|uniref:Glutamine synthetase n=1 Tax=Geodia barretti TaxID=519541 RepID=A0AA35TGP2_GEOBA|nr:Glutamine synthetase [Geodia barretti]